MRMLIVRSYCPQKVFYGGDMRVAQFVNYFRRFASLDLLTLTPPSECSDLDYVKKTFSRHYYFDSAPRVRTFLDKCRRSVPWQLTEFYDPENQKPIERIVASGGYDFIFVSRLEPLLYFLRLPEVWHNKMVMDFEDILSHLYRGYNSDFWRARENSFFLKLNESRALKRFNRVFVCAEGALRQISPRHHQKVGVIPNVYPYAERSFGPPSNKNRLLFVGSLDYFPNVEGLKWFLRSIWPDIRASHPDLTLGVVGKTMKETPVVDAMLGDPPGVEYFLNAPRVVPHYRDCFCSVVPIHTGSGTRLKILESAAYGRPVLTTKKGMEDLDFAPAREILLFHDASSFAAAWQKLQDPATYQQIVAGALRVLYGQYSQDAFDRSMDENWKIITAA